MFVFIRLRAGSSRPLFCSVPARLAGGKTCRGLVKGAFILFCRLVHCDVFTLGQALLWCKSQRSSASARFSPGIRADESNREIVLTFQSDSILASLPNFSYVHFSKRYLFFTYTQRAELFDIQALCLGKNYLPFLFLCFRKLNLELSTLGFLVYMPMVPRDPCVTPLFIN